MDVFSIGTITAKDGKVLWEKELGGYYQATVALGNVIIVKGATDNGFSEEMETFALDAADGEELWRNDFLITDY